MFREINFAAVALGLMTSDATAGSSAHQADGAPLRRLARGKLVHGATRRLKHGLILSLLAMLMAVALPGLAGARAGHDGGGFRHGRVHPGVASRFGGTGAWLGAASVGASHRFNPGGHEGSGWYHRGWGGTLGPGWGYGFGPNLGGSGGL